MKQPHYAFTWCCIQEGKQASLAADFSITQFKHLGRLLMVHGRNSYKRSAALSQFVIHRSLCISTMQVSGLSQGLFQWRGEKVKSKSKVLHFILDATISSSENFPGLEIEVVTWVWKESSWYWTNISNFSKMRQTVICFTKHCCDAACLCCHLVILGNTENLKQGNAL